MGMFMLDILLLRIEPIVHRRSVGSSIDNNCEYFVKVSEDELLKFSITKSYYSKTDELRNKSRKISEEICDRKNLGYVVAIDRFPLSRYTEYEKVSTHGSQVYSRYEVECVSECVPYDHILLICPNTPPILLSDLKFAYSKYAYQHSDYDSVMFLPDTVLSVKTLFGQIEGITLSVDGEHLLDPEYEQVHFILQAERINCSDAVLFHYLRSESVTDNSDLDTEDSD